MPQEVTLDLFEVRERVKSCVSDRCDRSILDLMICRATHPAHAFNRMCQAILDGYGRLPFMVPRGSLCMMHEAPDCTLMTCAKCRHINPGEGGAACPVCGSHETRTLERPHV